MPNLIVSSTFQEELGRGSYSVARKAVSNDSGEIVAIKVVDKTVGEKARFRVLDFLHLCCIETEASSDRKIRKCITGTEERD